MCRRAAKLSNEASLANVRLARKSDASKEIGGRPPIAPSRSARYASVARTRSSRWPAMSKVAVVRREAACDRGSTSFASRAFVAGRGLRSNGGATKAAVQFSDGDLRVRRIHQRWRRRQIVAGPLLFEPAAKKQRRTPGATTVTQTRARRRELQLRDRTTRRPCAHPRSRRIAPTPRAEEVMKTG